MVRVLENTHTVVDKFMAELRDSTEQTDSLRFRFNLRRVAWVLAYEVSSELPTVSRHVQTQFGELDLQIPDEENLVIATILRAGIPVFEGMLDIFDKAGTAFVSAYRNYHSDNSFVIEMEHVSSPSLEGKTLILTDAMLATGASVELTYKTLCKMRGVPRHTHIVSVIASQEGIDYVQERLGTRDVSIWTAALDDAMTAKAYIVPGLGDAGDLAFGAK